MYSPSVSSFMVEHGLFELGGAVGGWQAGGGEGSMLSLCNKHAEYV